MQISMTEKNKAVELKRRHEEYIFGQWGFLILYIISKGGKVEILYPKRKKYIDKRNQLDLIYVEVEGHCWKIEDFIQRIEMRINELCKTNMVFKRDIARIKRKDLHDVMMNSIIKWACKRSEDDSIKIVSKNGKAQSTRKEKENNLYIDKIEINGNQYDRKFIKDYYGDWMQKVLKYLFANNNKNSQIIISLTTLPQELLYFNNFVFDTPENNTVSLSEAVMTNKINDEFEYIDHQFSVPYPYQTEEDTSQMIKNDPEQFNFELNQFNLLGTHPEDYAQDSFNQKTLF
ncbi:hypothetical protein EDI_109630 [Entamoeba dispar SAW760]|uniref:Uncharacterized protein n=1 Tax=Entamoeba dispar (strain ATCC PRA-260 / SAW760) TaxID=370354 RepID=B0EJL7_ENTDS|nr:uncharacterized protein EDI_109630 [Entamoeba dispar SAW760]EDR25276.1 hypothetical protein EDI_109630 [Entamoeba dispar SAW760]|eukprot:EDR25276.1 hypothetical protein EDI_109630 [Entamoeba dispar SAW760]